MPSDKHPGFETNFCPQYGHQKPQREAKVLRYISWMQQVWTTHPRLGSRRLIVEFISPEPEEWTSAVRDLAVSVTEGQLRELFLTVCEA